MIIPITNYISIIVYILYYFKHRVLYHVRHRSIKFVKLISDFNQGNYH